MQPPKYICKGPHRGQQPLSQLLALKRPEKKITQHKTALLNTSTGPKLHTYPGRMQHRPWCRILPTLMREGSVAAASNNWRTALGRSDTGKLHQLLQCWLQGLCPESWHLQSCSSRGVGAGAGGEGVSVLRSHAGCVVRIANLDLGAIQQR